MTGTLFRHGRRLALGTLLLGAVVFTAPASASRGETKGGEAEEPNEAAFIHRSSKAEGIERGRKGSTGRSRRGPGTTGPRDCDPVRGTFTNLFLTGPANCPTSPIALCTEGELFGDLEGDYGFVFLTSEPVSQGTAVPIDRFTGLSTIELPGGTITGEDFGVLRAQRFPLADFTTHLRITSGTGDFEGASGQLTIQGAASFVTGQGAGTYVGVVCVPK